MENEQIVSEAMNLDSCVLRVEGIIQKDLFEDVALVRLTSSEGINFYFAVPYDTLALSKEV